MSIKNIDGTLPRILVISNNSFSKTKNNGKTLASFFEKSPQEKIAQLYFSSETPEEIRYNNYFRITDLDIVESVIKNKEICGGKINIRENINFSNSKFRKSLLRKIKSNNLSIIIRENFWKKEKWKTKELNEWLESFSPEVIFFCAGDSSFAYDITQYIKDKFNSKLIIYITDDYILPRKNFSFFWSYRRRQNLSKMKKAIEKSDLFVTISEEMRKKYLEIFSVDSILAMNMTEPKKMHLTNEGLSSKEKIIFVYTGGLHFQRFETLNLLAKAIKKYNLHSTNKQAFLEVYSGSIPGKRVLQSLNIPGASKFCGSLNQEELKIVLNKSTFPVHVESFRLKSIESTRLSLSTKIPEYLSLEKPVLAIGPSEVASMKYLSDSALCITDPTEIFDEISKLINDNEEQYKLSKKAIGKYEENHQKDVVSSILWNNILKIYNGKV